MTITPGALRTWLMRQPRPDYVVADTQKIPVAKTPRPWPELLDTLLALKPANVACYAESGALIRARGLDWDGEEGTESEETGASKGKSDLQVFASLLAEGYEKGSKQAQPLLESAMRFIEHQGGLLAAKDREIASLRAHNTKLQAELLAATAIAGPVEGEPDVMSALVAGIASAQAQQAIVPQPGPANGKGNRS